MKSLKYLSLRAAYKQKENRAYLYKIRKSIYGFKELIKQLENELKRLRYQKQLKRRTYAKSKYDEMMRRRGFKPYVNIIDGKVHYSRRPPGRP